MKKITIAILILLLSGCSLFNKKEEVKPVVVERRTEAIKIFHPPLPDAAELGDIKWKVLTPERMREYLDDLEKGEAPPMVFYAITPEGYKQLANNIADLKRVMKGYVGIILYYRGIGEEKVEPVPVPKEDK